MARPRSRTQALDVLFADTVFWFGLARNRDQHRARAKALQAQGLPAQSRHAVQRGGEFARPDRDEVD